jgi:transcriptional regulator with XRE-family HTH domain
MIAQARKKKEIGQKELAYLLGYKGVSSVCHIEYGRRLIPIKIVNRVSSLLGIPIPVLNQAIYEVEMEKDNIA